jgi:hypothetical protein
MAPRRSKPPITPPTMPPIAPPERLLDEDAAGAEVAELVADADAVVEDRLTPGVVEVMANN